MTAARRTRYNPALERAVQWSVATKRPLLVLEGISASYRHASARIHQFVLEGMRDNAADCTKAAVRYVPYVEPTEGAGRGLVRTLAAHAAVVVGDDHPAHPFLGRSKSQLPELPCLLEFVDGCGLVPLSRTPGAFKTAYAFRRYLQRELPTFLQERPRANPLSQLRGMPQATIPKSVRATWPELLADPARDIAETIRRLPIDHSVKAGGRKGGSRPARRRLQAFLARSLPAYAHGRSHPDDQCESGLSPYLHFGHISSREIFDTLARKEHWDPSLLAKNAKGHRAGWWNMSESAEAFLDQLITWRELGHVTCYHAPRSYRAFRSVPPWAQRTLLAHAKDPRPVAYPRRVLEDAGTADEIWNAAQRELTQTGVMNNYLRMNWGKRILEWSASPQQALSRLIYLNDKYALDGRDPNSYAGILWCLGKYDRPWGPERPIFGSVRYMTSAQTRRKLRLQSYLRQYGDAE